MKKGIRPLILGALALIGNEALADSLEFHTLYRSPYFLGRGDTGVSSADNHEAIFYNPAGLALGKGIYKETVLVSPSLQISTQTQNVAKKALVEKKNSAETFREAAGKNIHLGVNNFTGIVFRRFAIGGLVSSDANILLAKDPDENGLENLHADAAMNQVLVGSVAENFFDETLYLGTTFKYIRRQEATLDISVADAQNIAKKLDDDEFQKTREGIGLDIGVMFKPKSIPLSFGLHVENLGTAPLEGSEEGVESKTLPQIVTVGMSMEKATKTSSLSLQLDFRDALGSVEKNVFKRVHMGAEVRFARFIGLSGGLNQGYPTIGFFTNFYVVRMDIGLMTQELGSSAGMHPDQRLMFRLMAGF